MSPWSLTWDDENYYLIAYDKTSNLIKHYRVDKMQNMQCLKDERLGKEQFQNFDLVSFAKKTFAMYGGRDENVSLVCHNSLAGVILDRFGKSVWMIPVDDEHFKAKVLVSVSQQFFGWVTGIGDKMQLVGPASIKEEYKQYLLRILQKY